MALDTSKMTEEAIKVAQWYVRGAAFKNTLKDMTEEYLATLDDDNPWPQPFGTERSLSLVVMDEFIKFVENYKNAR